MGLVPIRPPSQRRQNPQSFSANQFGEGLATALSALGSAYDAQEETKLAMAEAEGQRQQKTETAQFDAAWIRTTEQYSRSLAEQEREAGLSGAGFANQAYESADQVATEFLDQIPDYLRPRYEAKAELLRQTAATAGYEFEINSTQSNYVNDLNEFRQLAVEEIQTGAATVEEWRETLDDFLSTSPLDAQKTAEIINDTDALLEKAQLGHDLSVEALQPERSRGSITGEADGSDIVAAGMPAAARATLNAIASVEAPGYDVMYSPDGTRKFSDYSDHPNQPATIASGPHAGSNSSAAGRYQFINGTWKLASQLAGVEDFSPESQDRAAWAWAKQTVREATGLDIETALNSGNVAAIRQVYTALGSEWEGIKKQKFEDFLSNIQGYTTGTPSALVVSDRYESVPYGERVSMWNNSQTIAEQRRAQEETIRQRELTTKITEFEQGLEERTLSMQDLQLFVEENDMSPQQQKQLVDTAERVYETEISAAGFGERLLTPGEVFEGNVADREAMGNFFQLSDAGPDKILQRDQEAVSRVIAPAFANAGFLPPNMTQTLNNMAAGSNSENAVFAMNTLAQLQQANPDGFTSTFGQKTVGDLAHFRAVQPYIADQEQLAEAINLRRAPLRADELDRVRQQARDLEKETPAMFSYSTVAKELRLPDSAEPQMQRTMSNEYRALFEAELHFTNDPDTAETVALERLNAVWGVSPTNPDQIMKFPPQKVGYRPFNGGYEYMRLDIEDTYNVSPDADIRLEADLMGGVDEETGRPNYNIVEMRDGVAYPLVDESGRLERTSPRIPDTLQELSLEQASLENQIFRLEEQVAREETKAFQARSIGQEDEQARLRLENMQMRLRQLDELADAYNQRVDELAPRAPSLFERMGIDSETRRRNREETTPFGGVVGEE